MFENILLEGPNGRKGYKMDVTEVTERKAFDKKLKDDLAHWFEIKVNGAPAGEEVRTSFQARDFADTVFDFMVEEIDMDEDDFDHDEDGDPGGDEEDDEWKKGDEDD